MSDMVRVPAEKIVALREAVETLEQSDIFTSKQIVDAVAAARAVVDAVETERCEHGVAKDSYGCVRCDMASPARDDAEKANLTDADRKRLRDALWDTPLDSTMSADFDYIKRRVLPAMEAAAESILAAHRAAPDELTALADFQIDNPEAGA